jgi:arylsulfatase A-like enzyme
MRQLLVSLICSFFLSSLGIADDTRPNILWFIVDDMSANFSCYGEQTIQTPNVDQLAGEGLRFSNAFVTAPVCSPCRSALITGMYQTTIGAHQHRSGRGSLKIQLPSNVVPLPLLFQQAGYFTCIGSGLRSEGGTKKKGKGAGAGLGKTDYNFEWPETMYDGPDWSGRKSEQPFFMQVQMSGGKLRGGDDASAKKLSARAVVEFGQATAPESVVMPPYYPRDPVLLRDWAAYLDAVRFTDKHVGEVLQRLRDEGLMDRTVVCFMTDHGISHARGKQFLYNEGTHVPLIMRGPGIAANQVREDLVEHISLAATSLALAGINIPSSMQGQNLLANDYQPREAIFAARDRCDETIERIRSVRTKDFLYIRNYYPDRPHLQPNAYKDKKSIVSTLRSLHADRKLEPLTEKLLFADTRASEELYAWRDDRWQLHNVASEPTFLPNLVEMRSRLDKWVVETKDQGFESEAMYDSDMKEYLGKGNPEIEKNIRWHKQGAKFKSNDSFINKLPISKSAGVR